MPDYRDVTGFMANVNRGTGFGDPLIAATRTAGDFLTNPFNLRSLASHYQAALDAQRQLGEHYGAQHPASASLARGLGFAAVTPTGETAALAAGLPVRASQAPLTAQGLNLFANFATNPPPPVHPRWRVQSADGHEVQIRAPDFATARQIAATRTADELIAAGGER